MAYGRIERQRLRLDNSAIPKNNASNRFVDMKFIGQSYTITLDGPHDLLLAVAVECSPMNPCGTLGVPVKLDLLSMVANTEVSSTEWKWEAHYQGPNLSLRSRCVDMLAEDSRRPGVGLSKSDQYQG